MARSPASATAPVVPSPTTPVAGSAVTPADATRSGKSAPEFRNAATCPAPSVPNPPMIRTDRELLADLARLNFDVVRLAMQIIDDIATREEQQIFAERFIELGTRLSRRARHTGIVIDSDVVTDGTEGNSGTEVAVCGTSARCNSPSPNLTNSDIGTRHRRMDSAALGTSCQSDGDIRRWALADQSTMSRVASS
jgi:hypothetical protein